MPVEGTRKSASAIPACPPVPVDRKSGRLCVTVTRRWARLFCLSDAEAYALAGLLLAAVAGVDDGQADAPEPAMPSPLHAECSPHPSEAAAWGAS